MNAKEIQAAIVKANTSQLAIARYLGVSNVSVCRVIHGKFRSTRIEAELAKIVGKPPFGEQKKRGRVPAVWTGQVQVSA